MEVCPDFVGGTQLGQCDQETLSSAGCWLFSEAGKLMGEGNRAAITECPMPCGLNNQACVLKFWGLGHSRSW